MQTSREQARGEHRHPRKDVTAPLRCLTKLKESYSVRQKYLAENVVWFCYPLDCDGSASSEFVKIFAKSLAACSGLPRQHLQDALMPSKSLFTGTPDGKIREITPQACQNLDVTADASTDITQCGSALPPSLSDVALVLKMLQHTSEHAALVILASSGQWRGRIAVFAGAFLMFIGGATAKQAWQTLMGMAISEVWRRHFESDSPSDISPTSTSSTCSSWPQTLSPKSEPETFSDDLPMDAVGAANTKANFTVYDCLKAMESQLIIDTAIPLGSPVHQSWMCMCRGTVHNMRKAREDLIKLHARNGRSSVYSPNCDVGMDLRLDNGAGAVQFVHISS